MAYDYSTVAKNAERLLKKYGKKLFIRRTTTTQNASTPWQSPTQTEANYTVYGIRDESTHSQMAESLVLERDAVYRVSAAGLAITPKSGDMVVDGNTGFEILEVESIQPADVAITYDLHVKEVGAV